MNSDWKTRITRRFRRSMEGLRSRGRAETGTGGGAISLRRLDPASLSKSFHQIFDSQNASVYAKVLTIVISSYFLADVIALGVGTLIPEPERQNRFGVEGFRKGARGFSEYESIISRNLINSEGLIPGEETAVGVTDPGGAPVRTTLPFKLVGTVVLQNESRSVGTIQDTSASKVYSVKPQDEIPGTAKILNVEPRRVVFVNLRSGRKEFVELPEETRSPRVSVNRGSQGGGGKEVEQRSATQFSVPRSTVDEALSNFNQVLTQARAVPNFENGVPSGYKLFQIVPGSIYDKLGLKNGDVLCGVNGDPIDNPGKAFEMLNELKSANQLELCVRRGGKQQSFSYDIN